MTEGPLIVAYGGGTNSTALVVGLFERGIRPDAIVFSDTGGERPETYAYLDRFSAWCEQRGMPITRVRRDGKHGTLEQECLNNKALPSIVFGFRSCSLGWKRDPFDKWVRHFEPAKAAWAAGLPVRKALGFDASERRRKKFSDDPKWKLVYPLMDWCWDRGDCVEAIARHLLPQPGKSACFFCPAHKKPEVIELAKTNPDLFQRAVTLERTAAERLTHIAGLGGRWSWAQLVAADEARRAQLGERGEMPCECSDGE